MTPREAIIRTLQRVPDQYSSMTSHEKSTMICWPDGRVLFCVEGPSPDGRGLQATGRHGSNHCWHWPELTEANLGEALGLLFPESADREEICEWCDDAVNNGETHGEGRCFDSDGSGRWCAEDEQE